MYRRSERKRKQTDRAYSGVASAAAKKAKHQHSDVAIKMENQIGVDNSTKLLKQDKSIHIPKLCTMFTKHVDKMINSREKIKAFVPLCGKAVEIKWLWEKGHEVVGVNSGEKALKEFFEEYKIRYSIVKIPAVKGKLYKSYDGRIRLYCCDFYQFSSAIESEFGAVWDHSGSLIASDLTEQEKYVDIIKSLMGEKCVNLTVLDQLSVNYDKIMTWFTDGFRVEASDYAKSDKTLKSFGIKGHQLYTIFKI
ncbi:probable thiopurine S-methyltransferase [Mytilus trossulus]|uniref:probable thiopurine S-methyltransferase n=1 Tax=Mytilus trossulus TaxID=6551 RepID=UPI0030062D59